MKGVDIFETNQWLIHGLNHPFFHINTSTVLYTWITLGILTAILLWARYTLTQKNSIGQHLTLSFVRFFMDLVKNASTTPFSFGNFVFITTMFCFILICNLVSVIPWMHEPTTDLNTTLSLGLASFLYTEAASIKVVGLWPYIKRYFSPFFIMLPLNVVGKLAMIVSISFRLFGNIFGGSIISTIYFQAVQQHVVFQLIGLITGINIIVTIFFGIFEGFLQAFVFAMLSLTYLSIALQGEGGH